MAPRGRAVDWPEPCDDRRPRLDHCNAGSGRGADRRKETNAKPKQGSALPRKIKRLQNRSKLRCESFARRSRSAKG